MMLLIRRGWEKMESISRETCLWSNVAKAMRGDTWTFGELWTNGLKVRLGPLNKQRMSERLQINTFHNALCAKAVNGDKILISFLFICIGHVFTCSWQRMDDYGPSWSNLVDKANRPPFWWWWWWERWWWPWCEAIKLTKASRPH